MAKINFKKIVDHVVKKAPGLMVGAAASNVLGNVINKMVDKNKTNQDEKGNMITATPIVAGAQILIGALLPGFLGSGKKDDFIAAIGDGIMANGTVQLGKALKIPYMSGTEEDTLSGMYGATEDYLSGTDTSNSLSGTQD